MEQLMDVLLQLVPTVISGLLAYIMYQTRTRYAKELAEQKRMNDEEKRLTDDQNNEYKLQIQALQNENTQTQAQLEIIKEYATGTPKMQETWQQVVNTMSERRLAGEKELAQALRELSQTNRENRAAVDNLSSTLEIQTTIYGTLRAKVEDSLHTYVSSASATHRAIDSLREDLQLVNKTIGNQTNRIDDLIAIDESHVLDVGKRHDSLKADNREHKDELVAIKTALQTSNSILEKILNRMEDTTQPLPALQDVDKPMTPLPKTNKDEPPQTDAA